MKKKLIPALILAAVLLFACVLVIYSARKQENGISIDYPKGYTVITADNAEDHEEYVENLGYGVSSFKKYLTAKNIISFAGNEDNSGQFRLISYSTEFTKQIRDISNATDKELEIIAKQLLPNGYGYIYRYSGSVYYGINRMVTDENISYGTIQFLTVKNGRYYSLNYYGYGAISDTEIKQAEKVLKSLKIPGEDGILEVAGSSNTKRMVYIVIISLVIIAGTICIVLYAISLVRDIRKNKRQSADVDMVIKRRKKL